MYLCAHRDPGCRGDHIPYSVVMQYCSIGTFRERRFRNEGKTAELALKPMVNIIILLYLNSLSSYDGYGAKRHGDNITLFETKSEFHCFRLKVGV